MVEPLTRGQQMFNQRLLAAHCMSEKRAKSIWEDLAKENDMGANTFDKSIANINEQLSYCGLEIRGVSIKTDDEKHVRFYSIINQYPDEIAQKCFHNNFHAHEQAYVRLLLERLVPGPLAQSTLLNLRNDLPDNHKIALSAAESTLEKLIEEKWLTWAAADENPQEGDKGKRRRGSNAAKLMLAPRTYMELTYMLVDEFGMDKEDVPQLIYHRA